MRNYYLFAAAVIFICGILLASCGIFKYTPDFFLLALTVIFFLLLFVSFKNNYLFLVLVSLLIFFLGLVRYTAFNQIDKDNIKNYTTYNKEKIFIQGEIISDIITTKRKESFTLSSIAINEKKSWKKTNGLVLVSSYSDKKGCFKYGDIVVLEGFLKVPSAYLGRSNFDYKKYLSKKKIYSTLSVKKDFLSKKINENKSFVTRCIRRIYSVRQKLDEHIKKHLKSPADSIIAAILLGKRENINSALKESFAKTGTLHILAISGLHVGVIYFALRLILKILKVRNNVAIIFSILFC